MAALYGVAPENLVVTRGADDAIDMLVRTFCRPGEDAVSICQPTFSAYAHFARLQGARVIEAPLDAEFRFRRRRLPRAVAGRAEPQARLPLLAEQSDRQSRSRPQTCLRVADALPETIIVARRSLSRVLRRSRASPREAATRRPNLVVLRTLSKAFGLAGARVGCAIGDAGD